MEDNFIWVQSVMDQCVNCGTIVHKVCTMQSDKPGKVRNRSRINLISILKKISCEILF